jgi:hypothetical protein
MPRIFQHAEREVRDKRLSVSCILFGDQWIVVAHHQAHFDAYVVSQPR